MTKDLTLTGVLHTYTTVFITENIVFPKLRAVVVAVYRMHQMISKRGEESTTVASHCL